MAVRCGTGTTNVSTIYCSGPSTVVNPFHIAYGDATNIHIYAFFSFLESYTFGPSSNNQVMHAGFLPTQLSPPGASIATGDPASGYSAPGTTGYFAGGSVNNRASNQFVRYTVGSTAVTLSLLTSTLTARTDPAVGNGIIAGGWDAQGTGLTDFYTFSVSGSTATLTTRTHTDLTNQSINFARAFVRGDSTSGVIFSEAATGVYLTFSGLHFTPDGRLLTTDWVHVTRLEQSRHAFFPGNQLVVGSGTSGLICDIGTPTGIFFSSYSMTPPSRTVSPGQPVAPVTDGTGTITALTTAGATLPAHAPEGFRVSFAGSTTAGWLITSPDDVFTYSVSGNTITFTRRQLFVPSDAIIRAYCGTNLVFGTAPTG